MFANVSTCVGIGPRLSPCVGSGSRPQDLVHHTTVNVMRHMHNVCLTRLFNSIVFEIEQLCGASR